MPEEVLQFSCPCCGQHAPLVRITEDNAFDFGLFLKVLGGKHPLTDDEREERASLGGSFRPGTARGRLDYDELPMTAEAQAAMVVRLKEALAAVQ